MNIARSVTEIILLVAVIFCCLGLFRYSVGLMNNQIENIFGNSTRCLTNQPELIKKEIAKVTNHRLLVQPVIAVIIIMCYCICFAIALFEMTEAERAANQLASGGIVTTVSQPLSVLRIAHATRTLRSVLFAALFVVTLYYVIRDRSNIMRKYQVEITHTYILPKKYNTIVCGREQMMMINGVMSVVQNCYRSTDCTAERITDIIVNVSGMRLRYDNVMNKRIECSDHRPRKEYKKCELLDECIGIHGSIYSVISKFDINQV